jgi:hypothetical protein
LFATMIYVLLPYEYIVFYVISKYLNVMWP